MDWLGKAGWARPGEVRPGRAGRGVAGFGRRQPFPYGSGINTREVANGHQEIFT